MTDEADHALGLASRLARHLADAHDLAADLALAQGRDVAISRSTALNRYLDATSILAKELNLALTQAKASGLARDLSRKVNEALTRARRSAQSVQVALERDDAKDMQRRAGDRVVPSAGRILTVAARLLPAQDRLRYLEEYQGELWDMAHAEAGRRQQGRYALRQLARAALVRAALLNPDRKSAPP